MKKSFKMLIILVIALGLAAVVVGRPMAAPHLPEGAQAASGPWQSAEVPGFKLVLGSNYTLPEGDILNMNLGVLGGNALLMDSSTVKGSVILLGGNLTANGIIEGDLIALGGNADLGSSAVVEGDVQLIGGNLNRSPGAVVKGTVREGPELSGDFILPFTFGSNGFEMDPITGLRVPSFQNPILEMLWLFARSFIWAVVAVLAALFLAAPISRIGEAAVRQPLPAGGIGCLTLIVVPIVLVLLAITLICIPISLLGAIVLWIAWAFGIVALGTEVGKKLGQLFHQEWAIPLSAGLGTFLLTLVVNGIGQFVPCFGWVVPLLVGTLATGAVLITRFGSRHYPAYASATDFTTPAASQAGISAPDAFQGDIPLPPPPDPDQDKP